VVDNVSAFRPVLTRVEVGGEIVNSGVLGVELDGPLGINNGTEEGLNFLVGSTIELVVDASNPGAVNVGVDLLNVLVVVERSLVHKEISNILLRAEFKLLAGLIEVLEVKDGTVLGLVESLVHESGEELHDSVDLVVVTGLSLSHSLSAELASELSLSFEGVDAGGLSSHSNSGKGEFHSSSVFV